MKIAIIGSNGMLSVALTKYFMDLKNEVDVYGLSNPIGYSCTTFTHVDLVKVSLDVIPLLDSDVIIYAAGAGVQADPGGEARHFCGSSQLYTALLRECEAAGH